MTSKEQALPQFAGEQLDALSLGLLRRKNFGTFVSALGEAKSTDGLTPTSDCWAIVPASAMQEGNKLWAAFQTDPTVDNQRQLLKGYKSGASESGLGKRRRRAPGDLSDYATDGEERLFRQETAGSGSTTAIRQAKQPRYVAAPKGAPTTTGSDGNDTERPIPPGRSKGKGKAVPPKKSQSSTSKTSNPLLSEKRRALKASEKRIIAKSRAVKAVSDSGYPGGMSSDEEAQLPVPST
ncbi:unnamed protein product [Tilletia caries]|uniref:ASX DEUBAD domain-containing protein n=1 Tax=Tilletia caries TaxID=13290 RepID=A0ABN7IWK9_9BASI|nr:unnamed protein product [Tilletia caries]